MHTASNKDKAKALPSSLQQRPRLGWEAGGYGSLWWHYKRQEKNNLLLSRNNKNPQFPNPKMWDRADSVFFNWLVWRVWFNLSSQQSADVPFTSSQVSTHRTVIKFFFTSLSRLWPQAILLAPYLQCTGLLLTLSQGARKELGKLCAGPCKLNL